MQTQGVHYRRFMYFTLVACVLCVWNQSGETGASTSLTASKTLIAHGYNSGFDLSHGTFNGMLCASNGRIYYVLCSDSIDTGAQMFSYDPERDTIRHLGDLTAAAAEKGTKAIPQGKSHVNFVESNGKLYFATHIGYYSIIDGMEKMGVPPPGYQPRWRYAALPAAA